MAEAVVAVLAFLGAGIGSGVAYLATRSATRTERSAREREEWGRRFTAALEAMASDQTRRRAIGSALLVELMRSPLAQADDRAAAAAVLESAATVGNGTDLRLVAGAPEVDDLDLVADTGSDERARGGGDDQDHHG